MIIPLRNLILCTMLLFIFGCATSDEFVRPGVDFDRYTRIAVISFSDYPGKPGSGLQVADIVSMELLKLGIDVVDRTSLDKVLREQSLGSSGLVDDYTSPEIGKLLGVNAIMTGTLTEWSTTVTDIQLIQGGAPANMPISAAGITMKLIDVETGQIIWSGNARASTTGNNMESIAAKNAIKKIGKQFIQHF